MISAIIFDMDDVIVNSSKMHFEAYERALKDFGLKQYALPPELRRAIYGMRIKEIMELLASHFKMDVNVAELTEHRNRHFMKLVKKGVPPMPGLFTLVENVKKWGLKRALASSGVREYVNETLKQLKLSDFFEAVVTGDDVIKPKPSPEVFLKAAEKLSVSPGACAVIEDADKGVEAARSAGMLAIGLQNNCGQTLEKADIVVSRLDEITLEMLSKAR